MSHQRDSVSWLQASAQAGNRNWRSWLSKLSITAPYW